MKTLHHRHHQLLGVICQQIAQATLGTTTSSSTKATTDQTSTPFGGIHLRMTTNLAAVTCTRTARRGTFDCCTSMGSRLPSPTKVLSMYKTLFSATQASRSILRQKIQVAVQVDLRRSSCGLWNYATAPRPSGRERSMVSFVWRLGSKSSCALSRTILTFCISSSSYLAEVV